MDRQLIKTLSIIIPAVSVLCAIGLIYSTTKPFLLVLLPVALIVFGIALGIILYLLYTILEKLDRLGKGEVSEPKKEPKKKSEEEDDPYSWGWKCECGRVNYPYSHKCYCGLNRPDIKEKKK